VRAAPSIRRSLLRSRLGLAGLALVGATVLAALLAPAVAPYPPTRVSLELVRRAPGDHHQIVLRHGERRSVPELELSGALQEVVDPGRVVGAHLPVPAGDLDPCHADVRPVLVAAGEPPHDELLGRQRDLGNLADPDAHGLSSALDVVAVPGVRRTRRVRSPRRSIAHDGRGPPGGRRPSRDVRGWRGRVRVPWSLGQFRGTSSPSGWSQACHAAPSPPLPLCPDACRCLLLRSDCAWLGSCTSGVLGPGAPVARRASRGLRGVPRGTRASLDGRRRQCRRSPGRPSGGAGS
jgi:hypothetical protein